MANAVHAFVVVCAMTAYVVHEMKLPLELGASDLQLHVTCEEEQQKIDRTLGLG